MKPIETLKTRIAINIERKQDTEKKSTLLDTLREHNRELKVRQKRTVLLRRMRKV